MKTKLRMRRGLVMTFMIILILLNSFIGVLYFAKTHFLFMTTIDGVSCSFLSIEDAIEKVNIEKGKEIVTFCFANGQTYDVVSKQLGIRVDETRIAQIFEQQHQNPKESREYGLDGFTLVDTEMLREFLEQIPELQEENMVEPQNAYMIWDETEFSI